MLRIFVFPTLLLLMAALSFAQTGNNDEKLQILKPPPGAKVALVEFEDFECPDCGRAHPVVMEAVKKYGIPFIRYDFPLPQHTYAYEAAIINRYFESKSKKLAAEYRDEVFKNQPAFADNEANFHQWVTKWAADHGSPLPFMIDPGGKFALAIRNDQDLGRRIEISHTPTIFIVTNNRMSEPFVEVVDRAQLDQMIEDAMKATAGSAAASATKHAPARKHARPQ